VLLAVGLGSFLVGGPALADGYWLSAELTGAANTRTAAAAKMAPEHSEPRSPPPLAGHYVGHVAKLAQALAWIDHWAFTGTPLPRYGDLPLSLGAAPIPGGALADGFGSYLLALVLDEMDDDGGSRGFTWPKEPPELPASWVPAAILSQRAPIFAAPAPRLPPVAESHDMALRSDDVYLLGTVDRCETVAGHRHCLRWAQVLVQGHGRWRSGYVPAPQVAAIDGWLRAPAGLPRVHAIPASIVDDEALYVIIIRTRDYELHRTTVRAPNAGNAFPALDLELTGDEVVISVGGEELTRRSLNASVDARKRE